MVRLCCNILNRHGGRLQATGRDNLLSYSQVQVEGAKGVLQYMEGAGVDRHQRWLGGIMAIEDEEGVKQSH